MPGRYKRWIAVVDAVTRDAHLAANGQVVHADTSFGVGGFQAMYPGAPSLPPHLRARCRCSMTECQKEAGNRKLPAEARARGRNIRAPGAARHSIYDDQVRARFAQQMVEPVENLASPSTAPVLDTATEVEYGTTGPIDITLYHGTTPEAATAILSEGMKSSNGKYGGADEYFFGTDPRGWHIATGAGDGGAVAIDMHLRLGTGRDVQEAVFQAREEFSAARKAMREAGATELERLEFDDSRDAWVAARSSALLVERGIDGYIQSGDVIIVTNPDLVRSGFREIRR